MTSGRFCILLHSHARERSGGKHSSILKEVREVNIIHRYNKYSHHLYPNVKQVYLSGNEVCIRASGDPTTLCFLPSFQKDRACIAAGELCTLGLPSGTQLRVTQAAGNPAFGYCVHHGGMPRSVALRRTGRYVVCARSHFKYIAACCCWTLPKRSVQTVLYALHSQQHSSEKTLLMSLQTSTQLGNVTNKSG